MSVFHFITLTTWEVLVLDGFLNSTFVLSPQKKAPTSHFYSSQHEREKNYLIHVHSFRNHILTP